MSTWVLLRGLARECRHWGRFPALLAEHMPGSQVILLDLPGNGRWNHLRSPLSVMAMAAQCRTELQARGMAPPYHLLAMSLGAVVAAAWATSAPHEVARMVLVNTSMRPFSRFHERLRPENYGRLLRLALMPADDQTREACVLAMTSHRLGPHDAAAAELLAEWVEIRRSAPVSRANALRQLVAAMRFTAPRVAPVATVLVLASANDALVNTLCSQQLAQAWQCPVVTHPTAGHDLPLDDGPWLARQLQAWRAETDRGPDQGTGQAGYLAWNAARPAGAV